MGYCLPPKKYKIILPLYLCFLPACRLPWDKWTDPGIRLCDKVDQFFEFDRKFYWLSEVYEQVEVMEKTGCYLPCDYFTFELVNEVICPNVWLT